MVVPLFREWFYLYKLNFFLQTGAHLLDSCLHNCTFGGQFCLTPALLPDILVE